MLRQPQVVVQKEFDGVGFMSHTFATNQVRP
jgi:hypothetical protein